MPAENVDFSDVFYRFVMKNIKKQRIAEFLHKNHAEFVGFTVFVCVDPHLFSVGQTVTHRFFINMS